jgi:hypothetical protein
MQNLLLEPVEYEIEETPRGVWRRFLYPSGQLFAEYTAHAGFMGLPLLHYTYGKCPETGRRVTARGVVAIGRRAVGIVAVGQLAVGFLAFGQLVIGVLVGLGQASTGLLAVGQLALAAAIGLGQFATGYISVGQLAIGHYVLAQFGIGKEVWDMRGAAPAAQDFFRSLVP